MAYVANTSEVMTFDGVTFARTLTDSPVSIERAAPDLPAALAGVLTTRSANFDGVVTLAAGPNPFLSGTYVYAAVFFGPLNLMSLLVGAPVGLTVPVSGGHGSPLPPLNSAVFIAPVIELPFTVDNATLKVLGLASPRLVVCDIQTAAGALAVSISADDGAAYIWHASGGLANPLSAATGKARFANGEPYPTTPQLAAGFN